MTMRRVSWALVAVLVMIGPGAASAQTVDAGRGELPVHVPSGYDAAAPAPLIVLLHGYTSSGEGQDSYMQVSALKDAYGFIMVAPDGTREDGGNRPRFWNASDACCNFRGSTVDDVAYLAGLIDAVKAEYAVDDKRVYLFGHSNGGFMSYRMAYEHPEAIAAIASLAGADQSLPAPAEPVHVLQIHGTADTAIPYESGSFRERELPGARESVESWAAHNGCAVTGVDSGT
ncbi:MAG: alpha/beta fold hydrolase, partial [Acidobacteria bacterium]|nr:alpha/beta fold hydrolase [Acidobacteriota bacterium]